MTIIEAAKRAGVQIHGILHVGACWLEEAPEYFDVGLPVVWVEAQPSSDRRKQIAEKYGHVLYEGCPLSDRTERVTLHIASNDGGSSSLLELKEHARFFPEITYTGTTVDLTAKRADEVLILPSEIDALVIDVQGYELKVLKGMRHLLDQILTVWVESSVVELYEGGALLPEILTWLTEAGFSKLNYHSHPSNVWGDALMWR